MLSMESVSFKLNADRRRSCFEIFGYDFIVDSEFRAWLIEINTNPCLEESSSLLKMLLPRMIDDALRITIDIAFVKKKGRKEVKAPKEKNEKSPFPVRGYGDEENLWELLCQLGAKTVKKKTI